MEPVFNQALKAGHVGFWCMQQKVIHLIVNNIGQNMGEEIYSHTLFNRLLHYQCANALVPQKGFSYQFDIEPLPTSSSTS